MALPFAELRLDQGLIIYGTSGGPEFSTDVIILGSGHEKRNQNWDQAKGEWEYGDRKLSGTELAVIVKFFRARKGRAQGFRFKDWGDYSVTVAEGILGTSGLGTGTATYQLYKQYASGSDKDFRIIRKPVAGTVKVFKNGVQAPSTGFGSVAIDTTSGIVTFTATSGGAFPISSDVLTWSGEFDVAVRFNTDQLKHRFDSARISQPGIVAEPYFYLSSLPIVEIRQD